MEGILIIYDTQTTQYYLRKQKKTAKRSSTKLKERESESFGLLMNAKITKTMVFSKSSNPPNTRIHIEGKLIEKVQTLTYFGALMTEDGRSEKEIKRRINIAKRTFQQTPNQP